MILHNQFLPNIGTTLPIVNSPLVAEDSANDRDERLRKATRKWRQSLGEESVLEGSAVEQGYNHSTTGVQRVIPTVLVPRNVDDIVTLTRIANQNRVPLYPISTGNNWGYGAANPVLDNCVIVDLSRLNRILHFDAESGLVTVEPGVTQQQLWEYVKQQGAPYYVPVHGGGPDCSLLGNALERGYGITPYADHFFGLTSLHAVLPSGDIYRPALEELNGGEVNRAFKWGIGPYMDGLFTQGNLGIVTQGTIALAPVPENTEAFLFSVRDEQSLEATVSTVRSILRSLTGVCGSINLMNAPRMLSMMAPYPHERTPHGTAIPDEVIAEFGQQNGLTCWTGAGALYGNRTLIRAARKFIRQSLRSHAKRVFFFDHHKLRRLEFVLRMIPFARTGAVQQQLQMAGEFHKILSGEPRRTALPLAYWKSGGASSGSTNPARDRCGLIWYSPLVPMKPKQVRSYVELVTRTCRHHGMDPLITLTSLSDRAFDSTVPLLFRRDDSDETRRARECYDELFEQGKAKGFVPYRVGVDQMNKVVRDQAPCWKMLSKIKQAVDPNGIIAPGRYAPTTDYLEPTSIDCLQG